MLSKAAIMNDAEAFEKIASAVTPAAAKQFGREIKGFDKEKWDEHVTTVARVVAFEEFIAIPRDAPSSPRHRRHDIGRNDGEGQDLGHWQGDVRSRGARALGVAWHQHLGLVVDDRARRAEVPE